MDSVARAAVEERTDTAERSCAAVVWIVAAAAAAVFAVVAGDAADAVVARPSAFAGFLAATVVLQLKVIRIPEQGAFSCASIGMLAAGFELGAGAAMAMAVAAAAVRWIQTRGRPERRVLDMAVLALASAAAAGARHVQVLFGGHSADRFAAAVVAAGAFYIVNIGVLSVFMALSAREHPLGIWQRRFRWLTPWALLFGPYAAVFVAAY